MLDTSAARTLSPLGESVTSPAPLAAAAKERKKDKVRSAWISFAGRIVAQIVGAIASVTLGIFVVQHYTLDGLHKARAASESPTVARSRSAAKQLAIAVLPLENFSGDAAQQHLADSLTEALIAQLAQHGKLRVISRTSTMHYKGERKRLPDIARELDVDMVIEGSIVRAGDRMRVIAQLIDGNSDEHIWAGSYDGAVDDVLAVEARLAGAISDGVLGSLPTRGADDSGARLP